MGGSIAARDEVLQLVHTGLFFPSYTHVAATVARSGIGKTGKLMAPAIAMAHGVVPFTGEPMWHTYGLRMYHVSVSEYPPHEHSWRLYAQQWRYPEIRWTPESSTRAIAHYEEKQRAVREAPLRWRDFTNPRARRNDLVILGECIELERRRQATYAEMSAEERVALEHPRPELYAFDGSLAKILRRKPVYDDTARAEHPFAPAEIKLERYLTGMFTSADVPSTRVWLERTTGKSLPVASLDALIAWEALYPTLPSYRAEPSVHAFFFGIARNPEFRQQVITETQQALARR